MKLAKFMGRIYLFVLILVGASFVGCVEDENGEEEETGPKYRHMIICYEVSGEGGNGYDYDYYLKYRFGESQNEREESDSYSGPQCLRFIDDPMDYVEGNMRKTNCSSCTAEVYIDIELDDGYTRCDEATTTGSNTISVSCSYEDYE